MASSVLSAEEIVTWPPRSPDSDSVRSNVNVRSNSVPVHVPVTGGNAGPAGPSLSHATASAKSPISTGVNAVFRFRA